MLAAVLVITVIAGIGGYLLGSRSSQRISRESITIPISPTAVQPNDTVVLCRGSKLGITVQVPDQWICEPGDYFLTLRSKLFTIQISNLGRGTVCPKPSPACITSEFYADNNVFLDLWTVNNKDIEIFGTFRQAYDGLTWISITYKGMETRKLTAYEKNELVRVVSSVKFNKKPECS